MSFIDVILRMYGYLLASCLILHHVAAQFDNKFAGPFDIVFKRLSKCDDEGTGEMQFDTRITKVNRTTYVYNGNFTIPYGISDDVKVKMVINILGNGGWKYFYKLNLGGVCSALRKWSPESLESGLKAAGYKSCPIPPGSLKINNFTLNIELKSTFLPYNNYKVELEIFWKGKKRGCVRAFIDIVPKKSSKKT